MIRAALLSVVALLVVSCTAGAGRTFNGDGQPTGEWAGVGFGGKGGMAPGGMMWDNEKSFYHGSVAAGVLATGYYGAAATKATEATKQVASRQAGATARNAANQETIRYMTGAPLASEVPKYIPQTVLPTATR